MARRCPTTWTTRAGPVAVAAASRVDRRFVLEMRGREHLDLEPMTGIEPAYSAWEADVLPLNYIGVRAHEEYQPCTPDRQ
jgi:hypothetical protein